MIFRWINLPPVWLFAFMGLAWWIAQFYAPLGDGLLWVGRALIGASLLLIIWAALAFHRARTTIIPHLEPNALVETGPYRYSRNPIYVADLAILAGWCISLGNPFALGLLFPFYAVLLGFFIRPEEERLKTHLGQHYVDYCARVRRWI
ncbi:MAG: isoprenylcysteine carboxylmethyltransferase family protein [Pseudomonadota bacterium]